MFMSHAEGWSTKLVLSVVFMPQAVAEICCSSHRGRGHGCIVAGVVTRWRHSLSANRSCPVLADESICLASQLLDPVTSLPSVVVSILKVLQAHRVDAPVVTPSMGGTSALHEALVGGESVSHTAAPGTLGSVEVWELLQQVLVDVVEQHAMTWGVHDGFGN